MTRLTRLSTLDDYKEYVEEMKNLNVETSLTCDMYLSKYPYQLQNFKRKDVAQKLGYFEDLLESLEYCPFEKLLEALYKGIIYNGFYYDVEINKDIITKNWCFSLFNSDGEYIKDLCLNGYNKLWFIRK